MESKFERRKKFLHDTFLLQAVIYFICLICMVMVPMLNTLDTIFSSDSSQTQSSDNVIEEATKQYNSVIAKHNYPTMDSILKSSDKKTTATIFLGDLPTVNGNDDKTVNDFAKKLDQAKIPHNWMFPNNVASGGAMRWDTSDNTTKNAQMYQNLDMPHFTTKDSLTNHDEDSNSPTCNFAYEIVLWSHHQPIAVYQCTTDIGGEQDHTKLDYPTAFTILDNQIDPNTGKPIEYQKGIAVFLRNKGDQEKYQGVSTYYNLSNQQPHVQFSKTDLGSNELF